MRVQGTCGWETRDLGSSWALLLGQLVTLDESFNISDPPFPSLHAGSNNAHLAWLVVD